MKNIINYLLIVLMSSFSLVSCSLQEEAASEINKNNFMNNAKESESVLLGIYRTLATDDMYGFHLSFLLELSSDLAQVEGNTPNGVQREYAFNAFNPTSSVIKATWQALYQAIYYANDFIETLEEKSPSFQEEKDKQLAVVYEAEARCLRALFNFELVRRFGHVALMTNTAMSEKNASELVQADPNEVYKFIEADLKFAIDNLPYAQDDKLRASNAFRFSKGAALGLLTRVYVTWAGAPLKQTDKWELAARTAEKLIQSGKHELLSSYEKLWENTCNSTWDAKESLIEVSFYAPAVSGVASEDPCGRIGKWNGVHATEISGVRGRNSGMVRVVFPFYRDWKALNDPRCDISIADYKYTAAGKEPITTKDFGKDKNWQTCTPAKWDTEKYVKSGNFLLNNDKSNINWYILRYADVLLLYAEALNEWKGAPTAEAYDAINMVRRRGFGLDVHTASTEVDLAGLDYASFQQAIRNERAYELAFEGERKLDLVRWGIYYETIDETDTKISQWNSDANYPVAQFTVKNKHELLPIPQRDMDLLVNFVQNPGWED